MTSPTFTSKIIGCVQHDCDECKSLRTQLQHATMAAAQGQSPQVFVVAKQTAYKANETDERFQLGYLVPDGSKVFTDREESHAHIKQMNYPIGWVSMTLQQLIPAALQPAQQAQPERALLSPEQILHLAETHVGIPNSKYPLSESDWINFARAIEAAIKQAQPEPEGWKLVPIEPAQEQLKAATECSSKIQIPSGRDYYRAMLAAAPQPKEKQ